MCCATRDSRARTPPSAWLYSSGAWAWGWVTSCSFPRLWLRSPPRSHLHTCREPQIISTKSEWWQNTGADYITWGLNLLEASVKVSRRTRHNGFDEERLLAVALLIAPDDAEAPALVVGLLQDDVPAPVHVTETTKGRVRVRLSHENKQNTLQVMMNWLYLGNPSQRVHRGVQLSVSSRSSSKGSRSSLLADSMSSSESSDRVWMTRSTTWDWAVWAFSTETASL